VKVLGKFLKAGRFQ